MNYMHLIHKIIIIGYKNIDSAIQAESIMIYFILF